MDENPKFGSEHMKPIKKAVFPAGGLGTRFLPATKAMPKEMLPVVDKPLIEYAMDEARAAGIEEFVFVTGRGKVAIQNHFDAHVELEAELAARGKEDMLAKINASKPDPGQIAFVRQMQPLGLGHAVWCARTFVKDEPFAVLLADDLVNGAVPCLHEMVEVYNTHGGNVVALMEVPEQDTSKYGIVDPGAEDGRLVEIKGLVEKPNREDAPSNLAIVGRYILQPEIIDVLSKGTLGAGGEIQLTDAMLELVGSQPFHGMRISGRRFDCGTKLGFLEANVAYALQRDDELGAVRSSVAQLLKEF
ncbi:UTP--glucose-1-phosphate uridylyltransferase [hydrothermal vent metagenome]|uniref:UTP--glucose-1-phosphate uridylyltransferase n=1 Tax=hydrothermal vent metagenome TaxID=652676 RepID=A0A3B0T127_9ZZZZ